MSVIEAGIWVSHLRSATEKRYKSKKARPRHPEVGLTIRLAALASGRNSGFSGQYAWMVGPGRHVEGLEIQFHGSEDRFNGAHVVIYIHGMQGGGVGHIITYKGKKHERPMLAQQRPIAAAT